MAAQLSISATPSETRARAEKGLVTRLLLPNRINHQSLPAVSVVDMKNEISQHKESNFSTELLDAIKLRIQRKEQIVLMLNRRGTRPLLCVEIAALF